MANTFTERIKLVLSGAKKATRDAKKFERGLAGIQKQALTAGAAFFGTQGIIQGMKQSVELASRFEEVQRGFMKLGASVNMSHTSISRLRTAVNGTVNDVDLMTMANQALMLGVAGSTDEMVTMFDAAQRLGTALGKDVKESIDSLVTGMGRQSIQMLDNLGIIVSAEVANDKYARKMGIVGRELDANERKLAFNEEATRQLTGAVEKLGDEQVTSAMKLQQASSDWDNFLTDLGTGFTPFTNALSDIMTFMKDSGIITDELSDALGSQGLASNYDEAKLALAEYMQGLKEEKGLNVELASTQDMMSMSTGQFLDELQKVRGALGEEAPTTFGFDREILLDTLPALSTYAVEYLKFAKERRELGEQPTGDLDFPEDPPPTTDDGFSEWREKQMEKLDLQKKHQEWVDLLSGDLSQKEIDALGLVTTAMQEQIDKQKERDQLDDIEDKRLQARKDQINMAMALGVAEQNLADAVSKASAAYISDHVRKIVATYIFEAFKGKGFLAGLGAVATGSAFGNLVGQTINSVAAAEGMDQVVTEPTLILAGEAGPEYVDIEPTTNEGAGRGGGTVIFQGNILSDDFIVDEAIPKIRKALQRGESLGIG